MERGNAGAEHGVGVWRTAGTTTMDDTGATVGAGAYNNNNNGQESCCSGQSSRQLAALGTGTPPRTPNSVRSSPSTGPRTRTSSPRSSTGDLFNLT